MQENAPMSPEAPTSKIQNEENTASSNESSQNISFAGFWKRISIHMIDVVIASLLVMFIHPMAVWVVILVNIVLYFMKGMTIGDFVMQTRLVKAGTAEKPLTGQLIGRFFAKILSAIPLNLGFIWAGLAKEKKAWHDSMSGTRYVETKKYNGGLTWLANILLLIVLPYFTMQPVISFVKDIVMPIGQGIFEGNPEKELEGIKSFGDTLEEAARKQMEKSGKIEKKDNKETQEKTTNYKKLIPAPVINKEEAKIKKIKSVEDSSSSIETKEVPKKDISNNNDSIIEIAGNYRKNSEKVFFYQNLADKNMWIESADVNTFEVLSAVVQDNWAKDKNNVYYGGYVVAGAAPASFKLLSNEFRENNWAYDIDSVFYSGRLVKGASPDSFELLLGNNDGYKHWGKDSNSVFFEDSVVKNADPNYFEVIDDENNSNELWAKDKKSIFFRNKLLKNSDPDSFVFKVDGTAEDKNNSYSFSGRATKK